MPSPFPGMDPYLENPSLWPDVHLRLINGIAELLVHQVKPAYFCQAEERVYIVDEFGGRNEIIPDISIFQGRRGPQPPHDHSTSAAVAEPIEVMNVIDPEIHEPYLQIIDAKSRQIVTVIEVLSPANKAQGTPGMASYREKRRQVLRSDSNWVEIDLLRAGARIPIGGRHVDSDYRFHWSRAAERPREWVQPIWLEQRLPQIPVPLRFSETEPQLDLQAVLNLIYERAAYEVVLDYNTGPNPPFTETQREWANTILSHKLS